MVDLMWMLTLLAPLIFGDLSGAPPFPLDSLRVEANLQNGLFWRLAMVPNVSQYDSLGLTARLDNQSKRDLSFRLKAKPVLF